MQLPDLRLVVILTCAITAIFFLFGWWFILNRSPLRMFLMVVGMFINRDRVGEDLPTQPEGTRLRNTMEADGVRYTFDEALQKAQAEKPMQALSAQVTDPMADNMTTTDLGYPRPLSEKEIDSKRPFLNINLDGDKDDNA